MKTHRTRIEIIYTILSGDDRFDRACAAIPSAECTNLPKNYVMNVLNGAASKLAEQVASAKLALPWLLSAMGAPAIFIGLLLPLRQTGTLLPQLAVAGYIRRYPIRKWFWVGSALIQVAMLMAIMAAAIALPLISASVCIVLSLLIFSMARGVGSVAFQDVTGKTIPKGKRGKMLAARSMIGGLLTIGVGLGLKAYFSPSANLQPALVLIGCGAVLWVIAALAFAAVKEESGAVAGGRNALREAIAGWRLMRQESWFFRYLIVRAALLSIELSGPFYIFYVRHLFPEHTGMLGVIVIAAGLAAVISSPFWGRFADLSSRKVLMLGGAMGAITGISALLVGLLPSMSGSNYIIAIVFVLLGISEAGVLLGRKTYLIDRVDPQQRSTFVAFANSAIGLIALLFGALGIIAQAVGINWLIGILVLLGASGSLLSYFLPEITAAPNPSE
ncbi:MAG: MFS transporter [Desulfobacterales bacterium]|nr:MFS transporter [Desulfobacterales bacterium]